MRRSAPLPGCWPRSSAAETVFDCADPATAPAWMAFFGRARLGSVQVAAGPGRAVLRNVVGGLLAMAVTYGGGVLLERFTG
ncbi:hypothetical protein ACIOJE_08265 [Kitasatospora sp. NPDC087861]|uniref:hypothetical protein n=1 Tax=Kitasatospora sp. NPDC087861 TaxID=3364070 RepID=UPI00380EDB07